MAKSPPEAADVRMRGFERRTDVDQAIAWVDAQAKTRQLLRIERVPLADAAGRVLARDAASGVDVPRFRRAMMDGFAVKAADIAGATEYNRLPLEEVGRSLPGNPGETSVAVGQAVRIMTGAPLPAGADAILPAEYATSEGTRIYASRDLPVGKHVGEIGEDVRRGDTVLCSGRVLRPQDIGVLSSIGVAEIDVIPAPRVQIVITGNELIATGEPPRPHAIWDANGPLLAALVKRDGGLPMMPGIVPDEPDAIRQAMQADAEVVIVSGGSSVGEEDHAPMLLASAGELAIHGIAMRPSSPTGMGSLDDRIVFLLPGNPVSCLCAYDFFAGRAIRALAGRSVEWPYPQAVCTLKKKISSQIGRCDYARVRLCGDQLVEPIAVSGASVLTSTVRADGFVIVPAASEGFPADSEVGVHFYDRYMQSPSNRSLGGQDANFGS